VIDRLSLPSCALVSIPFRRFVAQKTEQKAFQRKHHGFQLRLGALASLSDLHHPLKAITYNDMGSGHPL